MTILAYEDRPRFMIFLTDRANRGRYIKTHICVMSTVCPQCGASATYPCRGAHGSSVQGTHFQRRNLWREERRAAKAAGTEAVRGYIGEISNVA